MIKPCTHLPKTHIDFKNKEVICVICSLDRCGFYEKEEENDNKS